MELSPPLSPFRILDLSDALQPYVTELDLRHSLIPDELIEHLVQTMPQHQGPDLLEDRELQKYDYISFMEKMMENNENSSQASANGGN